MDLAHHPGRRMAFHLHEVIQFLDTTLEIDRFRDYAPNGLQVEGAFEV